MQLVKISPPAVCDIDSRHSTESEVYDAATTSGPWGWMCRACFVQHGVGLGVGRGQHYKKINDVWYKVGG